MKKLIAYYFLFLLSIFTILSSGVIDSQDGFQYLAVARNIYYSGEPTTPPVQEYDQYKNIYMNTYLGKDGNAYSYTGLGFSLAYLPAVAITDLVYKIYGVNPPIHFPLENDWLILLTASLTNSFFAALLGVILLLYLIELGLSKKQALLISLIGLFATNLLVYAKHSFAHVMFTAFLFTSFFLIKKHFQTKKNLYLFFAGVSFGITSITYNQTFILAILPLILYFLLLSKTKFRFNLLLFFLGLLPFIIVYLWFENLKAGIDYNLASPLGLVKKGIKPIINMPIMVFFEGIYGQILSPGRSIFLYSPILILLIFFWHKIKKGISPELIVFLIMLALYIPFYATQFTYDLFKGYTPLWHGESSWGPRYLTPLIPFGILIVGNIFKNLSKKAIYFVVFPLVIIGLYVEILGVLMPYQIKYQNLEKDFYINDTQYTKYLYSNLFPRYTSVISMSNNLVKLMQIFPRTFDHGIYNVRFYDGIDFPFNVGPERWRSIEGRGYISFDNNLKSQVKELTFGLINHPILESSQSAKIQFILNDTPLLQKPYQLDITQRELIKVSVESNTLKPKDNRLVIQVDYNAPAEIIINENHITGRKQILGLQSFDINGQRQNMESIDVPYISPLGPKMTGLTYQNWGNLNNDPWKAWDIHTQTFERSPDFWWIRNLYYWDIPKSWIMIPLVLNLLCLTLFGYKLLTISRMKR